MVNRLRARSGAAALTVLTLAITLAACAGGEDTESPPAATGDDLKGELDVRVYGDWPFVQRNAKSFMKENPDVKITVGGIDNDELRQSGGRIFTSDDAPDVVSFTYNRPVVEEWVQAGALLNVDDMWTDDLTSNLPEGVAEQSHASDGSYYAYPLGLTILPNVFYNQDALKEAGVTAPADRKFASMADFGDALTALQDAGFDPPIAAPGGSLVELVFFATLSSSCGVDTYQEMVKNWENEDAPKYTDECGVRAIQTMADWGSKGFLPDGYGQLAYDQAQGLFDSEKSAMWVAGSWDPPVHETDLPRDWAAFPPVDGGEPSAMGIGVDSFLIPAGSQNPAVAKAFIQYMTSSEVLEQGMGRVPARTDVDLAKVIGDNDLEISLAEDVADFDQAPYYGISVPASVLDAMVTNVGDGAVTGRLSAKDAAQALQDAADEYREQNQ